NRLARPANGSSIAFTILVTGSDEPVKDHKIKDNNEHTWKHRLAAWLVPERVDHGTAEDDTSKPDAAVHAERRGEGDPGGPAGSADGPPERVDHGTAEGDTSKSNAVDAGQGGERGPGPAGPAVGGRGNGNAPVPGDGIWRGRPPSRLSLA